ncbi:MAG TPA: hypothetical protein EYQ83_18085, partial [Acidobacteria bacterium]|nr:hypothetical protein [Acidobacteriota bacterium]
MTHRTIGLDGGDLLEHPVAPPGGQQPSDSSLSPNTGSTNRLQEELSQLLPPVRIVRLRATIYGMGNLDTA